MQPPADDRTVQARAREEALVVIAGFIHEVGAFAEEHPGGAALVRSAIGKDVTVAFFGGTYAHSNAAHNVRRLKIWCGS
jgi:stearoyl-CoA desaturase (delta-9 desaturase)